MNQFKYRIQQNYTVSWHLIDVETGNILAIRKCLPELLIDTIKQGYNLGDIENRCTGRSIACYAYLLNMQNATKSALKGSLEQLVGVTKLLADRRGVTYRTATKITSESRQRIRGYLNAF